MVGHQKLVTGERVDPRFATFTRYYCAEARNDKASELSGAKIADSLDRIIGGADPILEAMDAWENRNV